MFGFNYLLNIYLCMLNKITIDSYNSELLFSPKVEHNSEVASMVDVSVASCVDSEHLVMSCIDTSVAGGIDSP